MTTTEPSPRAWLGFLNPEARRARYRPGEWCMAYGGTNHGYRRVCVEQRGHTDDHVYRALPTAEVQPPFLCQHCERELVANEGSIGQFDLSIKLCHPSDEGLPDCYRRVTIYEEPLGRLKEVEDLPPGVEEIRP